MSRHTMGISGDETPKISSYREKRAQSKTLNTSNKADTKGLEEIQETLKTNMKRREMSTSLSSQPNLQRRIPDQLVQPQQSSSKIIEKYGVANITEVNEEQALSRKASERVEDETLKKCLMKRPQMLAKTAEKEIFQCVTPRATKIQKIDPLVNTTRKMIGKLTKPTTPMTQKSEKKIGRNIQIKLDNSKLIKKVESLEDQLMKAVQAERQGRLKTLVDGIISLLRHQDDNDIEKF